MAADQQFQHVPLTAPSQEFRVITILPGHNPNYIECNVFNLSLEANTNQYHTLSYLWGAETPMYSVRVNGKTFYVRQNLWRFLQHARARFPEVPFFIDAICIDQMNMPERNQQVQIMGDIYRYSELTVAWLGEGNAQVDRALPFIRNISNLTPYEIQQYYDGHDRRDRQQAWASVYFLCDIRYWSRIWIVQEVLKPKQILLIYGDNELHWDRLSIFLDTVRSAVPCPAPLPDELFSSRLNKFDQTRDLGSSGDVFGSMTDILLDYCSSHCSESKDRIFALLSLGIGGNKLKVDYSMHQSDLFMEAIRLWGAESGDNALVLAKHLASALLALPADYAGRELDPKRFVVKLIDSKRRSEHDHCASSGNCLSSHHVIRSHGYASFSKDIQQSGRPNQNDSATSPACTRTFNRQPRMLQLSEIRHSQLRCEDIILQIEDTSMFVVARSEKGNLSVVARLAVVVDEVDQASRIVSLWLPWSKTLAELCQLTSREEDQYQIAFNAYSLRTFLYFVSHERAEIELRSDRDAYTLLHESLRWQEEPQGSGPISAICRLQALYHNEVLRERPSQRKIERPETLSISHAHQALRSSRLNLVSPEDFKPTPSWKQLIGRN